MEDLSKDTFNRKLLSGVTLTKSVNLNPSIYTHEIIKAQDLWNSANVCLCVEEHASISTGIYMSLTL